MAAYAHLQAPGAARNLLPIIAPVIDGLGYALIRLRITGEGGRKILQIMAERADGSVTIDDCATISRALAPVLDVEDAVMGAYVLEVSSPGMARPLTRAHDFENWAGHEARIETAAPIDGQKRFRGVLEGFTAGEARLRVMLDGFDTAQILGFDPHIIAEARLIPDEAALTATLKASGKRAAKPSDEKGGRYGNGHQCQQA